MIFVGMTVVVVVVLLGLELLFRLGKRGRVVLSAVYLIWTVVDAFLTAGQNHGHELGAFAISFFESIVPLVLWRWISSAIRNSKQRRKAGNLESQTAVPPTKENPAFDYIKSMPQDRITKSLITALPGLSTALFSEAQKSAKTLGLNDHRFVECVLDLQLLAGFNKTLEFTNDKALASLFVDAIVFNLTSGNPGAVPSELEFQVGGTENYRGIAKYAMAKDHFSTAFPEAWLFGKEYSQIKTGNAMDFAYVASVGPSVVAIMKTGAFIFQHFLKLA